MTCVKDGHNIWVPPKYICDGRNDCEAQFENKTKGEDELHCSHSNDTNHSGT